MRQDPLSQLISRQRELRARLDYLQREITGLEPAIEKAKGERFRTLMTQRDGWREQLVESRTQLGPIEADIVAIRRRDAGPPKADGFRFTSEIGENGLPVDSIQNLRW